LVVIFVEDVCYVANLGDSKALISEASSQRIFQLTKTHRPSEESERLRIVNSGGYIYIYISNNSIFYLEEILLRRN